MTASRIRSGAILVTAAGLLSEGGYKHFASKYSYEKSMA